MKTMSIIRSGCAMERRTIGSRTHTGSVTGPSLSGYSLIEMLVYGAILVIIMAVAYAALYRSTDTSVGLRRNTTDIVSALRAGENWRADIRRATRPILLVNTNGEQILQIHTRRNDVAYRFADGAISRRIGNTAWRPVLANVKSTSFAQDPRTHVTAWRWELELQMRTKKFSQITPLFTFMAVPEGGSSR